MNYYIVNDIDRPEPRHVAGEIDDRLYYLIRDSEVRMKQFDGMSTAEATPMSYFGFEITEGTHSVTFQLRHPSKAHYKKSGLARVWQDEPEFFLPKLDVKEIVFANLQRLQRS